VAVPRDGRIHRIVLHDGHGEAVLVAVLDGHWRLLAIGMEDGASGILGVVLSQIRKPVLFGVDGHAGSLASLLRHFRCEEMEREKAGEEEMIADGVVENRDGEMESRIGKKLPVKEDEQDVTKSNDTDV